MYIRALVDVGIGMKLTHHYVLHLFRCRATDEGKPRNVRIGWQLLCGIAILCELLSDVDGEVKCELVVIRQS